MLAFNNEISFNSTFFLGSSTETEQMSKKAMSVESDQITRSSVIADMNGKRYKVCRKKPVASQKTASCANSWMEEAASQDNCNDQFNLLKKMNAKRNNTARKESNRIDCVFSKLVKQFEKIQQSKQHDEDLDKVEMNNLIAERSNVTEINPVSGVELFLAVGAQALSVSKVASSKKIKKQQKPITPESSQVKRKLSFSTDFTSENSSVASPSSPTPMDMYANYEKSTNLYSSRKTVESPILYRSQIVEEEKEEDDKISFFNFSSNSEREESTVDELKSLDFIFERHENCEIDNEPRCEEEINQVQDSCFENDMKVEDRASWYQKPVEGDFVCGEFSVGCGETDFSVVPNLTTENSVEGDDFEATLSCFDHLL